MKFVRSGTVVDELSPQQVADLLRQKSCMLSISIDAKERESHLKVAVEKEDVLEIIKMIAKCAECYLEAEKEMRRLIRTIARLRDHVRKIEKQRQEAESNAPFPDWRWRTIVDITETLESHRKNIARIHKKSRPPQGIWDLW